MNPPTIKSNDVEKEAILQAARLMLLAARTAPKTGGIDDVFTSIVHGKEKDAIADKMDEIAQEREIERFRRDAGNVKDSDAVVLIGVKGSKNAGMDCGACGYKDCKEFEKAKKKRGEDFLGPTCVFKALDLGIALGSAAKTAGLLNVDNRIMYRIGAAASKLIMLPQASVIMGIPLSARGKNIYFDRK
jgi:uncharacterized ferredoxin-like protein